jgi:hypothetical protein
MPHLPCIILNKRKIELLLSDTTNPLHIYHAKRQNPILLGYVSILVATSIVSYF